MNQRAGFLVPVLFHGWSMPDRGIIYEYVTGETEPLSMIHSIILVAADDAWRSLPARGATRFQRLIDLRRTRDVLNVNEVNERVGGARSYRGLDDLTVGHN